MVNTPRTQKFKKDTCYKLFKIAKDDLYAAKVLSSAPSARPETVVYHIQQTIEKSLKAVLVFFETAVPLTHDLEYIVQLIPAIHTKDFPQGLGELTQFATIKRYMDGDELIEPSDIQSLLKLAEFYISWCEKIINPE